MNCLHCGSKLDNDAVFCTNCGKKITDIVSKEEIKFCMNCGNKLDADSAFCSNCGKKVEFNELTSTGTITDSPKTETKFEKTIAEEDIVYLEAETKEVTSEGSSSKTEVDASKTLMDDKKIEEKNLDKNKKVNSVIQNSEQESTKNKAETSKLIVERTQNENDKNLDINENNVTLLSLKEFNCLSTEDKESYKLKLDALLVDERIDAETKRNICKTLIQYGYIYYCHSKYIREKEPSPTIDAGNEIVKFVSCLYCGEKISDSDEICPKCGKEQSDYKELKIDGRNFLYIKDTSKVYCPKCHKRVDKNSTSCFNCNANFMTSNEDKNIDIYIPKTVTSSINEKKERVECFQKTSNDGKQGHSALTTILIIVLILSFALIILLNISNKNMKNNSVSERNTKFKIGDIIQENGTPIAVIFKEANGEQPALGVALKQGDSLQWASCHYDYEPGYNRTTVSQGYEKNIRGLQNLTDGHDNYKILCNSVNDWQKRGSYPAFEYAENYSVGSFTDWYLPTANELYYLYINLERVNSSLMQCGGKKIKISSGEIYYWTCNQVDNTSWAAICTDFCQGIDSARHKLSGSNQKGGGFTVLPIHRIYVKED